MLQRTLLWIALMGGPLGLAQADDWPQWRGPDRMDVSKETGLLPSWPPGGPKLLWTFRDAGEGYSCLDIVGDRLYTMGTEGNKDCIFALDLKTHKKLWSTEVGAHFKNGENGGWGNGPRSTPTIDGNWLYAISGQGKLVCVDTARGKKVWSQDLVKDLGGYAPGYGFCESPLVDGDQVVVTPCSKEKGAIAAFDKKTGKLKWLSPTSVGFKCHSSMIAIKTGGVRQYVQGGFEHVVGVRASDGKPLWKFTTAAGNHGDVVLPIYQNDCVYVSCFNSGSFLLKLLPEGDHFQTRVIYANRRMKSDFFGTVLVGEHLYGCFEDIGWVCQDFKTGKTVWKKNVGKDLGQGNVTFADGNLYGYHENRGDVLLIKATPEGYQEQGRFRIPEVTKLPRWSGRIFTRPVVSNGKLYLRDHELIFCYDVRKPR